MDLDVLHLDNHLLVVNKPPGLLAQADVTGDPDLLTLGKAFLKDRFRKPGNVFLGLVHRLDRPASGVIVLARTSKAAARLSEQFRRRSPRKTYLAIVEGKIEGEGTLRHHLVKEDGRVRMVDSSHPSGREAELHWRALGTRETGEGKSSLLQVDLVTGRAHQIRVQVSAMGHPIVGDMRYGAERELDGRNIALHSRALTIEHPTLREAMTFVAPPPAIWPRYFDDLISALLSRNDGPTLSG